MQAFARPRVVVSACLGFKACRYNGVTIPVEYIEHLKPFVDFVEVCPEVQIGLGVPRDPVRIVEVDGERLLIQPAAGKDLTRKIERFTEKYLESLEDIDGFILKERSPSCGLTKVRLYIEENGGGQAVPKSRRGSGFFGGEVLARFPHAAVEDEGRLRNVRLREHFYTKIFSLARFRQTKASGAMSELVHFHSSHKYLLMAASQKELKILGQIVANPVGKRFEEVIDEYQHHLHEALSKPPRPSSLINVLMHVMGYFELSSSEKTYFLDLIDKYRSRKLPLSALVNVARSWIGRFGQEYLADQVFFEPYPAHLAERSGLGDEGEMSLR